MPKYLRKSYVVDAFQYTGNIDSDSPPWVLDALECGALQYGPSGYYSDELVLFSGRGDQLVPVGHYITYSNGELSLYNPVGFNNLFELIGEV